MPPLDSDPFFSDTPARPPFDAELVPAMEVIRQVLPTLTDETLPQLRQYDEADVPGLEPIDFTVGSAVTVEERQVPGPEGAPDIALLILRPTEEGSPRPAIYHIHGGGMVAGNRRNGINAFLPYVADGSAVVVSVEYRLAPEHPDPAPVEDCYAGLVWTAKNAAELGIDLERLILTGGSAGGGLAAGTALLARDRAFPNLSHQVLVCPMLDDRFETHSSRMLDEEGVWDRDSRSLSTGSQLLRPPTSTTYDASTNSSPATRGSSTPSRRYWTSRACGRLRPSSTCITRHFRNG